MPKKLLRGAACLLAFLLTLPASYTYAAAPARVGDALPVSRAMAAKMLALATSGKARVDSLPRVIAFTDTTADMWYDRYINAVFTDGLMAGHGAQFEPNAPLTEEQAKALLSRAAPGWDAALGLPAMGEAPITYRAWLDLYDKMLAYKAIHLTVAEVVPLVTSGGYAALPDGNVITDAGPMGCAGYELADYVDRRVRVYARDGEIVAVYGVTAEHPIIKNVLILKQDGEYVTVFAGGAERTYRYGGNWKLSGANVVADITVDGQTIVKVDARTGKTRAVPLRVGDGEIILDIGAAALDADTRVYSVVGAAAWKTAANLTLGADMADYYIADGKLAAAVIDRRPPAERIRVLISRTGFDGYVHDTVRVTGTTAYTVTENGAGKQYAAGSQYNLASLNPEGRRLVIQPLNGGKLRVDSIKRAWEQNAAPEYRGNIELIGVRGGWYMVNELPLEEYLYAVIPSETPTSYGAEALKAQAVTARSYAIAQMMGNRYAQYGANVDDSTACQVYNNIPENEAAIRAADETAGVCVAYGGEVVAANFFSTSAGVTANAGDVWATAAGFPGETPAYLSAVKQYSGADYGDLSQEANAAAFFKATRIDSLDAAFPWFRWQVTMTAKQLEQAINKTLAARSIAAPERVKVWSGGAWVSKRVSSIGSLTGLEALARGKAGNITKLKITGTAATVLVEAEYNIRALLSPASATIKRHDGSVVSGYSLMPSAFFTMDIQRGAGGISAVTFYGGGSGHGVGLSQNGAKAMADAGFGYVDILKHYYTNIEVIKY